MHSAKHYHLTGEHFYKFFQCPHWIWYDLYEDKQKMGKTPALMDMIYQNGLQHEHEVIKSRKFEEIKPELYKDLDEAFLATVELMKKGVNIYHGVLMDSHWVGIPDLLEAKPVEKGMKSIFGDHYYVVYDIKSGMEIRDDYKFQLTFYSLILERIQGVLPREAFIINGMGEEHGFVVDDFLDYFHLTRERIERILDGEKPAPFLKSSCKTSPWFSLCLDDAKACDDISLIHRLSQNDQRRLYDMGIRTVKDLATADMEELRTRLEDWQFDKILRFHNQANVLMTNEPMILKKADFPDVKTEIYFDIESDPTEEIDYLLGVLTKKGKTTEYKYFLAKDKADEERIWREFLNFLDSLDDFVIYHYAHFEQQVFKRFADQYGISRELENKFKDNSIDLWRTTIEAVVLPLYFYSLKDVAKYLGFKWDSADAGGAESVVWYNDYLKTKDTKILDKILRYNEDDVRATLFVKEWLEKQKPKTSREKLD
ncbi:MAG: TM0106 family RecB-like putative nuclease [Patescibacteria group bacterium]